jgi:hypothetical protein
MKQLPPLVYEGHQKITLTMMAELLGGGPGAPDFSPASIGSVEVKLKQMKSKLKYGAMYERRETAEQMRDLGKKLLRVTAEGLQKLAKEMDTELKSGDAKRIGAFWEKVQNATKMVDFAADFWLSGTQGMVEMGLFKGGPNGEPNAQLTAEFAAFKSAVGDVWSILDTLVDRAPGTANADWGITRRKVDTLGKLLQNQFGTFEANLLTAAKPGRVSTLA